MFLVVFRLGGGAARWFFIQSKAHESAAGRDPAGVLAVSSVPKSEPLASLPVIVLSAVGEEALGSAGTLELSSEQPADSARSRQPVSHPESLPAALLSQQLLMGGSACSHRPGGGVWERKGSNSFRASSARLLHFNP